MYLLGAGTTVLALSHPVKYKVKCLFIIVSPLLKGPAISDL